MGRKSISGKLDRARTDEKRLHIAWEWAQEWEDSSRRNMRALETAISERDFDAQCRAMGHLKEDLLKRLGALPRVMERLADEEDPPYIPKNKD